MSNPPRDPPSDEPSCIRFPVGAIYASPEPSRQRITVHIRESLHEARSKRLHGSSESDPLSADATECTELDAMFILSAIWTNVHSNIYDVEAAVHLASKPAVGSVFASWPRAVS
jgi:hypothetical protein